MARDKDENESGFTGKRKKTWRELDATRGKSKYHSRQDDPQQQRIERSATYERYKAAADSLFTGGELPDGLAKAFDPEGKRKAHKEAMLPISWTPCWIIRAKRLSTSPWTSSNLFTSKASSKARFPRASTNG